MSCCLRAFWMVVGASSYRFSVLNKCTKKRVAGSQIPHRNSRVCVCVCVCVCVSVCLSVCLSVFCDIM